MILIILAMGNESSGPWDRVWSDKSPFYQVWDDFNASDFSAFSRFFGRKLAKRTFFKNLQTLYQDSLQVVKGTVSKFDLEGLSKVLISKFQTLIAITWLLGKMWSNESEICPFYAALYSHHSRQSHQVITRNIKSPKPFSWNFFHEFDISVVSFS